MSAFFGDPYGLGNRTGTSASSPLEDAHRLIGLHQEREVRVIRENERLTADRDRWIRAFNRLEAAITHHKKASVPFQNDHDEALWAARDKVLASVAAPLNTNEKRED